MNYTEICRIFAGLCLVSAGACAFTAAVLLLCCRQKDFLRRRLHRSTGRKAALLLAAAVAAGILAGHEIAFAAETGKAVTGKAESGGAAGRDAGGTGKAAGKDSGESDKAAGQTGGAAGKDTGQTSGAAESGTGETGKTAGKDAGDAGTTAGRNTGETAEKDTGRAAEKDAGRAESTAGEKTGEPHDAEGVNAGETEENANEEIAETGDAGRGNAAEEKGAAEDADPGTAGTGEAAGITEDDADSEEIKDSTAPAVSVTAEDSAYKSAEGAVYLRADNAALKVRAAESREHDKGLGSCHVTVCGQNGSTVTKGAAWTQQGQKSFEIVLEKEIIAALGDGKIRVRIDAEDLSGNRSWAEEDFILDTCSPVLHFKANRPVGNDAAVDSRTGTVYYGADRSQYAGNAPEIRAVFTVEDTNISTEMLSCRYVYLKNGTVFTESSGNIETEQEGGENGSLLIRKSVLLHPGETDCPDGGYRFMISGTDLAGNPLAAGEAEETDLTESLSCEDPEAGSYVSGIKIVDTKAPAAVLTVSTDEEVVCHVNIREKSSVADSKALRPYQSAREAVMKLAGVDESPVQLSWRVCSTDGSRNKLAGGSDAGNSEFQMYKEERAVIRGDQVFWAEDISVRDRAGNTSCTLKGIPRLYLDTARPSSDLSAPSATVRATGEVTAREADGRPLFGSSVILQICASDPCSEVSGTGLREVVCDVWAGEKHIIRSRELYHNAQVNESGSESCILQEGSGPEAAGRGRTDFHSTVTIPAGGAFESNRIRVEVRATDLAGNCSDPAQGGTCRFGIDTKGPSVTVTFGDETENRVHNGKYFSLPRTAVIRTRDRNPGDGTIRVLSQGAAVSSWQSVKGADPGGSLDEKICTVQWMKDGDYTLEVSGTDALGNPASVKYEGEAAQVFTIDSTPPVIEVKWMEAQTSVTGYYNRPRAARVRILETNFSSRGLRITRAGTGTVTGAVRRGSQDADSSREYWEGVVIFRDEGEWRLACAATDLAGNTAVPFSSETFVIDMTPPLLYFDEETVAAGGAYAGKVTPRVLYSDENLEPGSLKVRTEKCVRSSHPGKGDAAGGDAAGGNAARGDAARGDAAGGDAAGGDAARGDAARGDAAGGDAAGTWTDQRINQWGNQWEPQDLKWEYESSTDDGGSVLLADAEHDREDDGLWICEASVRDLAGNCSRIRRQYCLNRYGSVYEYTGGPDPEVLFGAGFIDTEEPIEVTEYAGSRLLTSRVTLYRNGERRQLTEGKEYRAEQLEAGDGYCCRYAIYPSCFAQDGRYVLTLESEDTAGHRNSSAGNLPLRWSVDRTAPTCGLTGLKEGQQQYQTDVLPVKIIPADNLGLSAVTVRTRSDDGTVLKEETYKGEELETALVQNGGGIPFRIEASGDWQTLEAEAADAAGNRTAMDSRRVLVASNPLVHIYRSGIIPAVMLITAAVAASILVFHSSFTKTL